MEATAASTGGPPAHDDPKPGGDRVQLVGEVLLRAGVLAVPLMCLAGIFLLTAGTDECFLLLHIRGLVEHGRIGEGSLMHSSHTLSTTGPYTLATSLLSWIGRGSLPVVRLMSVLSLVGMIIVLLRLADRTRGRREPDRWLVPASLLIVHGLFLLGSQAYGEVLATTLLLNGVLLWAGLSPGSWRRRLWTGATLGMAVAARLNCMPIFAALAIPWLAGRGDRCTEFRDAAIAVGTGLLVFGLQWLLFLQLARDPMAPSVWMSDFGMGAVLSEPFAFVVPKRLGFYLIGQDHLPLVLAAGITAAWCCWARRRVADSRPGDVLLGFAWLEGLAWLFKAPIPHLRYLWPSLVAFAAVGGLTLAAAAQAAATSGSRILRRGILAVALGGILSGYLEGTRMYLHGESDILSFEYQRATHPNLQYGPFKCLAAQRAVIRHLQKLPAQEGIATFAMDTALAYHTRRPIVPILCYYLEQHSYYLPRPLGDRAPTFPRWLVVTPIINRLPDSQFPVRLHEWLSKNGRLEARYGPYLLYEIAGPFPSTPEVFRLDLWEPSFPGVLPPP